MHHHLEWKVSKQKAIKLMYARAQIQNAALHPAWNIKGDTNGLTQATTKCTRDSQFTEPMWQQNTASQKVPCTR